MAFIESSMMSCSSTLNFLPYRAILYVSAESSAVASFASPPRPTFSRVALALKRMSVLVLKSATSVSATPRW
jgi:hypothetical protein